MPLHRPLPKGSTDWTVTPSLAQGKAGSSIIVNIILSVFTPSLVSLMIGVSWGAWSG